MPCLTNGGAFWERPEGLRFFSRPTSLIDPHPTLLGRVSRAWRDTKIPRGETRAICETRHRERRGSNGEKPRVGHHWAGEFRAQTDGFDSEGWNILKNLGRCSVGALCWVCAGKWRLSMRSTRRSVDCKTPPRDVVRAIPSGGRMSPRHGAGSGDPALPLHGVSRARLRESVWVSHPYRPVGLRLAELSEGFSRRWLRRGRTGSPDPRHW